MKKKKKMDYTQIPWIIFLGKFEQVDNYQFYNTVNISKERLSEC